jgi:hypothetical protein
MTMRDTLRISATTLDLYRLWLEPNQEWCQEADLIAAIRGEVTPSPAMELGKAVHAIVEEPDQYRVPHGYACCGYGFSDETLAPLLALYDRHGVPEVKATLELDGCTLVAQADLLAGTSIHEFKTTGSYTFDPQKYADAYQWRVMSLIFDPQAIHYHVVSLDDHGNTVVEIRWIESFTVYPYPELREDVRALLASFRGYVEMKGFDEFLRQRQRTAAA